MYYLIILIDIYLSENINKRKKQIFLGKDNNIDLEKIILLKKFFNKNNIKVFEYNISYVNDFIVLNTLSDMDLDLAIYLYKNEINNKYYLKIYNKDGLLSKEKINELINKSHNFDKEIKLSENKDSIQLNIDKFLNYYINKNNNHITKSEFKQDVLNIKITIEDPKSEYILLNLLRKFGYLVKRNIQKFKWETKIKKYLWIYFKWLNYNLNKYDLLIYIDKFNQLSIYLKIKNKFILIKDEELTYLYINYYYLTWKQNKVLERNKIFIPHYTSSSILNLLNNFNIHMIF
ncbi:MAG5620 family putative phospho-sugar mutase [Mycoplasmopsis felis]|uniref:MAG5620 family putative phospho-sugar mutase n=1 Tax=Mycoplasmopsis felis TaxID=33923 RepID=UPI003A5C811D